GKKPDVAIYEEKRLIYDCSESQKCAETEVSVEAFVRRLSQYDVVSFDIFDTLIFRPFSEPTDLFYFIGFMLGMLNFKQIRMNMEHQARQLRYKETGHYEVTLEDIWKLMETDTGISAETGMRIELDKEMEFCYANPFMKQVYDRLLEMGKDIIIISDMYLPKAFLQQMLAKNGYTGHKELYVSNEFGKSKATGALFDLVKADFYRDMAGDESPEKTFIHVGDNLQSDVAMAKKHGFASCYYPNVNKNTLLYRSYDMSPIIGGAYRGLVNNKLYNRTAIYSMEYEYGYVYGGIFVIGYCNFIHEYCRKNKIDKILFLSRDGDVLMQAYERLFPEDCERIAYAYWSRRAATKLMAGSDRYDYFRRFLYHKVNQNISLEKILTSMELENLLPKLAEKINITTVLTDKNVDDVKKFLMDHWEDVLSQYVDEHKGASAYYKKLLNGCKKAVAVDIGWAGSGAICLNHLVSSVWDIPCEIIGIVAGTNTIYNAESDASETFLQSGKLVAYLYSSCHNRDLFKKHDPNKNYNVFWELLLSSPTPQVVGFGWNEKAKTEEILFGRYDENLDGIIEVQRGILDFVEDYMKHFGKFDFMYQVSGRDAYAPMLLASSNEEKYLKTIEKMFQLEINVS
ncbi:MAG: HAD family hydrolase, partial [Agathobacter sp.]